VFLSWAKVGKAKLIANPIKASSERVFIVFSQEGRIGLSRMACFGIFSRSPVTSVSPGAGGNRTSNVRTTRALYVAETQIQDKDVVKFVYSTERDPLPT
jgi:hypothetical protein